MRLLIAITGPHEPFKTSLHMVHGLDVARAIMAVHDQFSLAAGSRWIVTDGRMYVSHFSIVLSSTPFLLDTIGGT